LAVFLTAFFFGLDTARRVKLFKVLRGPFPLVVFLLLGGIVVVEEVLRGCNGGGRGLGDATTTAGAMRRR
jgi:hypothetical protein